MKIGILTQPLEHNYGGILQNYALQTVLSELGHEACTINIAGRRFQNPLRILASAAKRFFLRILGEDIKIKIWYTVKESNIISQATQQFVIKNVKTTDRIRKKVDSKLLEKYSFDAYIVGSDQVWRPRYSPQLATYFLDFLKNDTSVKKIAYAASFGVSDWEFTNVQNKKYGSLLKQFDAVSVREDTAIDLCDRYFGLYPIHVLDPTMLLNREIYISLAVKENVKENKGNLFTYILDKGIEKNRIVELVSQKYDLNAFSVMQKINYLEDGDINDRVFPPVEEWIRGFVDAQFVVTDSFHGTVFSILFNKPFIAIVNKGRGLTRFTSLLKLFQLEDRMVDSFDNFNFDSFNEIDWNKTNAILNYEKHKSLQFLREHLTSD